MWSNSVPKYVEQLYDIHEHITELCYTDNGILWHKELGIVWLEHQLKEIQVKKHRNKCIWKYLIPHNSAIYSLN